MNYEINFFDFWKLIWLNKLYIISLALFLEFYFTSKIVRSRLSKTTRNFLKIYKPTKVNKLIGLVKRSKLKYREI